MSQDLAKRVTRLEKENRRLRTIGLLAVVGIAGALAMGQGATPKGNEIIEARGFRIVDENGNGRGSLGLNPDGLTLLNLKHKDGTTRFAIELHGERTLMRLFDENKKPRHTMQVSKGVPSYGLLDGNGKLRLLASAVDDIGPGLSVLDEEQRVRGTFGYTSSTGSQLLFVRSDKRLQLYLGAPEKGPRLDLLDGNEKRRATLMLEPDGAPYFGFMDSEQKPRMLLSSNNGSSSLGFLDGSPEKSRMELSSSVDGSSSLSFSDSKEELRFGLGLMKDAPFQVFIDEKGVARIGLGIHDGAPEISVEDENGKSIWKAPEEKK